MLTIFPVRSEDAGSYECQISTEPKKSKVFKLHTTGTKSTQQLYWQVVFFFSLIVTNDSLQNII